MIDVLAVLLAMILLVGIATIAGSLLRRIFRVRC